MLKMRNGIMRRSMFEGKIPAAGKRAHAVLAAVIAVIVFGVLAFGQQSRREHIFMNGKAIVTETSAFSNPAIVITYPTSGASFNTSSNSITVAGSASEASGIVSVTWANNRGGNGSCMGTASWNCSVANLQTSQNQVTITAVNSNNVSYSAVVTINYCTYTLSAASANVGAGGGSSSVSNTCAGGCNWTAARNHSWITITSGSSATGDGTVGYSVAANTSPARTGTITIAGQTFTINQASGCSYALSPAIANVSAAGVNGNVVVTTGNNCQWTAASNASWITITYGSSASGTSSISYSVAANTGPARSGTITIAGQTFTVNQANGCVYSLPSNTANIAATASSSSFNLQCGSNCAWTTTKNGNWITVASSGSGPGSVAYSVTANPGPARTGTITIGGKTFTINQASGCVFTISPEFTNYPPDLADGVFTVSTTNICSWTAVSNSPWIIVTSGDSGTGNGTVYYFIYSNAGDGRGGAIDVGNTSHFIYQDADIPCNSYCVYLCVMGGDSEENCNQMCGCSQ